MGVLDKAVTSEKDLGYTFQCPGVEGSPCGDPGTGRPFVSSGWPTKKSALERGRQHFDEHKLGAEVLDAIATALADGAADDTEVDLPAVRDEAVRKSSHRVMQELHEFRVDQGIVVDDDGSVSVGDL